MASKSLPLNSPSSLVTSITKILQSLNPKFLLNPSHSPPIEALSQFSSCLNSNLVIQVIKNQPNPYHALIFFNWSLNPSPNPTNYFHSFSCYIAMFDLLLSHRLFSTSTQFLEIHRKLCDFTIAKLIKAFGAEGNIRACIDWFHKAKMIEKNGNCLSSFNTLLSVLVKSHRIKLACGIFNQTVEEGLITIDVITYSIMIKGYCQIGKMEDARKVFDEMRCLPNSITYGNLVNGFCKQGMMVEARQIVDKMIMNKHCLPNLKTYTMLIDGYSKKGDIQSAMLCLDEMVLQGLEPNLITYNAIINGFCLIGKIDEAKKMMTKMRLNGVKDDIVTHTSLLRGFCVVGRLDEAVNHLNNIIALGIKPDVRAYGLVLNEFCKLGKANEAVALLREIVARDINLSTSNFNAVLKVLVQSGELNEAILLLKWMPKIGRIPNFLSYFTVISSLSKTGRRIEQVEELVDTMVQYGHRLDVSSYSCLIMMYSNNNELDKASRVFRDALRDECVIGLESFVVVVEGLCAKEKMREAEELAQELFRRCSIAQLEEYQKVFNALKCKYSLQKS
ncbi:pentatricopeptide repeat-containing protein At5g39710-like [Amaranthus tricolor]|uniref:pentatricopeptide repeat-containing protein At5g39710-like n=1 Tax=Amaranthus tricolor TaxID=29722 RepID=UPI00258B9152|nr:pentatricopeptide repeat-containing protein At5g39710-like [Amaranthus tricolor]